MRLLCISEPLRGFFAALVATVSLAGCAGSASLAGVTVGSSASAARYVDALSALARGHEEVARAGFEALAREAPAMSGPHRQLARLALADGDADAAVRALEAASAACGDCAPVLTELGYALRRAGAFEAARDAYDAAIARAPDYAPAHYDLAVLHELYLGGPRDHVALAIAHYERYLALAEGADDADAVRSWLRALERDARRADAGGGAVVADLR